MSILHLCTIYLTQKFQIFFQIKSEYVVKAFITRIKEVNIIINAMVDTRYEDAIREAQQVDELIACCEKSEEQLKEETPFLGVPYTTKECFEVKGKKKIMIVAIKFGVFF